MGRRLAESAGGLSLRVRNTVRSPAAIMAFKAPSRTVTSAPASARPVDSDSEARRRCRRLRARAPTSRRPGPQPGPGRGHRIARLSAGAGPGPPGRTGAGPGVPESRPGRVLTRPDNLATWATKAARAEPMTRKSSLNLIEWGRLVSSSSLPQDDDELDGIDELDGNGV